MRFVLLCSGSADTFACGYPDACGLALKRSKQQVAVLHSVESCPVNIGQLLPQQCGGISHVRDGVVFTLDKGGKHGAELCIIGLHAGSLP